MQTLNKQCYGAVPCQALNLNEMKNIKIPRKLKKSLKSAVVNKYPCWLMSEVKITDVRTRPTIENIHSKGVYVSGYELGK